MCNYTLRASETCNYTFCAAVGNHRSPPLQLQCNAMQCYAMQCYAMLCYAMLCYAMLCYAMLCYAMLCYAMFCFAAQCVQCVQCSAYQVFNGVYPARIIRWQSATRHSAALETLPAHTCPMLFVLCGMTVCSSLSIDRFPRMLLVCLRSSRGRTN